MKHTKPGMSSDFYKLLVDASENGYRFLYTITF